MTTKTTKLDTRHNKIQHRIKSKNLVTAPVCKEVDFWVSFQLVDYWDGVGKSYKYKL